ncbi:MAG: PKD domain-containing protein [Flavobacteriales bacterium]|nr:PKD domain-containing protein [Flavobacteriales bacterium]
MPIEQAFATHLVGGEIYYEQQGTSDTYLVTLKVYRDCGPANTNDTGFDEQAAVGIFEDGMLLETLLMDFTNAEVDFVPVELNNPCFVLPPDLCVERAVYQEFIDLPFTLGGYTLVYQRCCRNPSIVNLNNPQDTGATFFTVIPGTENTQQNSSPIYTNFPPVALCTGGSFWFDHGATDEDGDSLVYEFCTPLHGATPDFPAPNPPSGPPFIEVDWASGYSADYPIDSNPAFTIDPQTGFIEGTPTMPGQYVVGICVSEYRNGEYLSTTKRDFQFNVTICDPNIIASIPDQVEFCDGLILAFENESVNSSFYFWDFGVEDLESDTSISFEPTYTYSTNGTYTITLIANPGWPCADTASTVYEALPVIEPEIILDGYECVDNTVLFNFDANANASPEAEFLWDFGPGALPQFSAEQSPQAIDLNDEDDQIIITLTVTDDGCEENDDEEVIIPPDPVAAIVPQETFCDGMFYIFENASENADEYYWDFGTELESDFSFQSAPSFMFPDTGHFVITLVASGEWTCSDTTYMEFLIYGLLDPEFPEQAEQCFEGNSFYFEGLGASTDVATYLWDFGNFGNPATSTQQNPQNVSFTEPGSYLVTLTISENDCLDTYEDLVQIFANPTIDFSLNTSEGCPPLGVAFNANATADTQIFYEWDFGDGATSNSEDPAHYYQNPGTYDVTLTISTINGCIEEQTMTLEDAIWVYPKPVAGFSVTPQQVTILDPVVSVTDLSQGSISCIYYTEDGFTYTDCNFIHTFIEAGFVWIHQYVTNEYGCVDDQIQQVIVEGFLFYAPNAFTPDGDGLNDVWLPSMIGISQYELQIFNRWGDVIYESQDPNMPWLGEAKEEGNHLAQNGVYNYRIRVNDLLGLPHDFAGHITLFR